jgi:hypothetical protein
MVIKTVLVGSTPEHLAQIGGCEKHERKAAQHVWRMTGYEFEGARMPFQKAPSTLS